MSEASIAPEPGQIVRVRSRQYLVEAVTPPPAQDEQTLVKLSCLDDDAQGVPLSVLWESEVDAGIVNASSWRSVVARGFDDPRRFSAYLHVQRWNCVTSTDPKLFQAPYRAGIEVQSYQLEPLRKALLLPRVNLFIADDVGVGKTIEAGLILRELLMRQKVRKVVVACPPSVVLQWRDELDSRFGLSFAVFDRAFVTERRRERGYAVNPWSTHSLFILSHALLRDEAYAAPLRDWLEEDRSGSLLILDEAHNAAPAQSSKYAIDSKLTRSVRGLAELFEHRLFLSATPHNGHSNSFAALLEILDPQRFCRGVKIESTRELEPVMVRRLKEDLRRRVGGFPERRVVQIDIGGLPEDAPELRLSALLDRYRALREEKVKDAPRSAQNAASLICISLQKRLLSSIAAFASTLRVHRASLEKASAAIRASAPAAQLSLELLAEAPGSDDDRAEVSEADVQAEEDAQMEAATHLAGSDRSAEERRLLDEMTRIAEAAASLPDPRVQKLVDWIRERMCPALPALGAPRRLAVAPAWNDCRILIFTEYATTKDYLAEQLAAAIAGTDRADLRIETFHGGITDDKKREAIKRAFNQDPREHPLRILIATDAAREGVNLQNHCADLFHFDIPWNPSRMEQRNGRIDRKLQRAEVVRCHYFVLTQREEDRVLQVLVEKTVRIRRELGSLGAVVERRLSDLLEKGIPLGQIARLTRSIDDESPTALQKQIVQQELEDARERDEKLSAQIEVLRKMLGAARSYLELDEEAFRQAISCSLELLPGGEPLRPLPDPKNPGGPPLAWAFPDLDRRRGADPSWLDTLDTLRVPRKRDQDLREWRRDCPIRPIVFHDVGSLDETYVHLHLEHRVAQRLLGRFLSQGFVHDDLSRACVLLTDSTEPTVVLLGRLALYGEQAARLHDEILAVAAPWVDPVGRRGALKPMSEADKEAALERVERSLGDPAMHRVADDRKRAFAATIERDVGELLPRLAARGDARAKTGERELGVRADKEAAAMERILREQAARIGKQQAAPQLELQLFTKEEKRQLDADRSYWDKRLLAIEEEIVSEPERIRRGYAVKARRVDAIGVVYLWPRSG